MSEEAREEWTLVPRRNPGVEMLRKHQSTVMRIAMLF
jgi:hypothetical protein